MPVTNRPPGRRRYSSQTTSVTKIGARLASSVAFATEVSTMDQCHTARSPANSRPAMIISRRSAAKLAEWRARPSASDHAQSSGSASATRQKPVATGPVSLTLTNRGETAMATAPASSAATAKPLFRESGFK
ncbi:hypothetical protein D3C83_06750 [compost metagenome]